jgi:hypothetical protein
MIGNINLTVVLVIVSIATNVANAALTVCVYRPWRTAPVPANGWQVTATIILGAAGHATNSAWYSVVDRLQYV